MLDATRAYGLSFAFPAADTAVGASLKTYGEFARPELDFLIDHGRGQGQIVDVGANIGAMALPIAKALPDQMVVAIEAHRGLCNLLAANAVNNHLHNVEVIHAAVGASEGVVDFPAPPLSDHANYGTMGFHTKGIPTEPTRMLTLDGTTPNAGLVKIDVEGFEPEVLRGAEKTLRSLKPVWLAEVTRHQEEKSRQTIRVFLEAGYTVHWFFAPFATQKPLKTAATPPSLAGDYNVVALPPGHLNSWDLVRLESADAPWSRSLADFPYLKRYGFGQGGS